MELKFDGPDVYHGDDDGEPLSVENGQTHKFSQSKAEQLLADFPDWWSVVKAKAKADKTPPEAPAAVPVVAAKNAKNTVKDVKAAGLQALDDLEAAEKALTDPRKSVLDAITARRTELAA